MSTNRQFSHYHNHYHPIIRGVLVQLYYLFVDDQNKIRYDLKSGSNICKDIEGKQTRVIKESRKNMHK